MFRKLVASFSTAAGIANAIAFFALGISIWAVIEAKRSNIARPEILSAVGSEVAQVYDQGRGAIMLCRIELQVNNSGADTNLIAVDSTATFPYSTQRLNVKNSIDLVNSSSVAVTFTHLKTGIIAALHQWNADSMPPEVEIVDYYRSIKFPIATPQEISRLKELRKQQEGRLNDQFSQFLIDLEAREVTPEQATAFRQLLVEVHREMNETLQQQTREITSAIEAQPEDDDRIPPSLRVPVEVTYLNLLASQNLKEWPFDSQDSLLIRSRRLTTLFFDFVVLHRSVGESVRLTGEDVPNDFFVDLNLRFSDTRSMKQRVHCPTNRFFF